jgi:ATP-dependent RNA helicase DDX31/DBP7
VIPKKQKGKENEDEEKEDAEDGVGEDGEAEEGAQAEGAEVAEGQLIPVALFKLHGDLSQVDRTKVYFSFCKAQKGILFCTDVAARGLDLPAVNWIVQYDPPSEPSEYIHRVGRTARLGHTGRALMFLMPSEIAYADLLQNQYKLPLHKVSLMSILKTLPAPKDATDALEGAVQLQIKFEEMVKLDRHKHGGDLFKLAGDAFVSSVRAYATHSAATKHIFHVKNLHLGHLAKSFALSEPPTKLMNMGKAKGPKYSKGKLVEAAADRLGRAQRHTTPRKGLDEADDGLDDDDDEDGFARRTSTTKRGRGAPPQKRKRNTNISEFAAE